MTLTYAVNLSILFTELPLLDRPAAAAAAGFDAVELWWPFPEPVPAAADVDALVGALDAAGVRLVAMNFAAGDVAAGERGWLSQPANSARFRDNVDAMVRIASRTGCRLFNALYGKRVPGVDPAEQDSLAVENLAFAARTVSDLGGIVLVEPQTRADNVGYPLPRPPTSSPCSTACGDGPARRTCACSRTCTTWRATVTTCRTCWRRISTGSATCRSPTRPAVTSPVPVSSTSPPCSTSSTVPATPATSSPSTSRSARAPRRSAGSPVDAHGERAV